MIMCTFSINISLEDSMITVGYNVTLQQWSGNQTIDRCEYTS